MGGGADFKVGVQNRIRERPICRADITMVLRLFDI